MQSDAWLVLGGSFDVLKWYEERPEPVCSFFGRFNHCRVAAVAVGMLPPF